MTQSSRGMLVPSARKVSQYLQLGKWNCSHPLIPSGRAELYCCYPWAGYSKEIAPEQKRISKLGGFSNKDTDLLFADLHRLSVNTLQFYSVVYAPFSPIEQGYFLLNVSFL